MDAQLIGAVACVLLALGVGSFGTLVAMHDGQPRWQGGQRGAQRQRALGAVLGFRWIDPPMRWLARWIALLPIHGVRAELARLLRHAGGYLGCCSDELLALAVISAAVTGGLSLIAGNALALGIATSLWGTLLGPAWLALSVREQTRRRCVEVDRALPAVIDLVALCMGAGLDFPGSLRLVVEQGMTRAGALHLELQAVLRELDLGTTRAAALRAFGERVPTRFVADFTASVVQAEEKGTPLLEVLRIQATVMRGRRSVMAEEAAARAGVMMMLPLLLLLGCVMLVAMGGMVIRGTEAGL